MRRYRRNDFDDLVSLGALIAGIIILGVFLLVIARLERGLLGVILGALTAALVIYWLRETRAMLKSERSIRRERPSKWNYDMIDSHDEVRLVAEVPGPEELVKVTLSQSVLEIKGGGDFRKNVTLQRPLELVGMTYVNGVLNVRLRKEQSALRT
jgi:hypothetical protein